MNEPNSKAIMDTTSMLEEQLSNTKLTDLEKIMVGELLLEYINSAFRAKMTALSIQKHMG